MLHNKFMIWMPSRRLSKDCILLVFVFVFQTFYLADVPGRPGPSGELNKTCSHAYEIASIPKGLGENTK